MTNILGLKIFSIKNFYAHKNWHDDPDKKAKYRNKNTNQASKVFLEHCPGISH